MEYYFIVCIWIEMPTETNMMNATEREYKREALRFLKRWADMFFSVKMKSVLLTQNKVKYATSFSKRYWTL